LIDRHSSNDAGCGVKRSAQVAAASANAMTERSMFKVDEILADQACVLENHGIEQFFRVG
jgi:hypothetical protein